jgi:SAM-dependent methyltransferase
MQKADLTAVEQQTVEYYNQQGKEWSNQHQTTNFFEQEIKNFSQFLPNGKILEIGAGAGNEAQILCQMGYDYVGTDISTGLLDLAKKANPGTPFFEASVYDLAFAPNTFDGFWAAAVLLHVPKARIDEAFDSLKTVLKSGAYGFISLKAGESEGVDNVTNRFFSYYTSDEFTEILKKHNFSVEKCYEKIAAKRIKSQTWLNFFVRYNN